MTEPHPLAAISPAWSGWSLDAGELVSPEGWRFTPGDVRAGVYQELRARTLEADLRALGREPTRPALLATLAELEDFTARALRLRDTLARALP